jgi:hypothetical protein
MNDFYKGFIAGAVLSAIIFGLIVAIHFVNMRDKELTDYAEKQMEIEALRDDVINRDPSEFVDTIPDVRRAADGAAAEFERRRDEALQRFRSGNADCRGFASGFGRD